MPVRAYIEGEVVQTEVRSWTNQQSGQQQSSLNVWIRDSSDKVSSAVKVECPIETQLREGDDVTMAVSISARGWKGQVFEAVRLVELIETEKTAAAPLAAVGS